jgi:hypothetical protein
LIKLIFAGRNRIIMIRRELPLTTRASQVEPVARRSRGFSFVLAPAAADPVLELDNVVHSWGRSCFFPIWNSFCFCLFGSRHAAIGWQGTEYGEAVDEVGDGGAERRARERCGSSSRHSF